MPHCSSAVCCWILLVRIFMNEVTVYFLTSAEKDNNSVNALVMEVAVIDLLLIFCRW